MLTPAMRVKHEVLAKSFARDGQRHTLRICLDDGSVAGKGKHAVARLYAGDRVAYLEHLAEVAVASASWILASIAERHLLDEAGKARAFGPGADNGIFGFYQHFMGVQAVVEIGLGDLDPPRLDDGEFMS